MENVFINLRGEMAKNGIEVNQVATAISKSRNTVREKMSGKRAFTVPEAKKIKSEFFPSMTIEYLFSTDERQQDAG